jgi:broad specificity phosphatase PhoE
MYTGQVDVALTDLGLRQAARTAEYVAETYKIDAIYSSDLKRAMSTAIPLSEKLGLPVIKEPLIKEIYGGLWENKLMPEIDKLYHDDYQVYKTTIGLARCTGGESLAELQARALEGMKKIAEANDGKTVFVATHGGVLLALISAWMGLPLEKMHETPPATNSSITEVVYANGEFKIEKYSFDEHLGSLKVENDMHLQ